MKLRLKGKYWGKYCDVLTELKPSKFTQGSILEVTSGAAGFPCFAHSLERLWARKASLPVVSRLSAKRHLEIHKGSHPLPLFLKIALLAPCQRKAKSKGTWKKQIYILCIVSCNSK